MNPKPFNRYDWLKWGDLERCPYVIWTPAGHEWIYKDNHRMLLIALDRYADYLEGKMDDRTNKVSEK